MKNKLLILISLACLACVSFASALQVQNIYTVQPSTYTVMTSSVTGAMTPQINASSVLVKDITFTTGVTAQTVTMYKNGSSTRTIEALAIWDIPASSVIHAWPTVLTDEQNINVPEFYTTTTSTYNIVHVNVLYK